MTAGEALPKSAARRSWATPLASEPLLGGWRGLGESAQATTATADAAIRKRDADLLQFMCDLARMRDES